jgi:hypothetical protein
MIRIQKYSSMQRQRWANVQSRCQSSAFQKSTSNVEFVFSVQINRIVIWFDRWDQGLYRKGVGEQHMGAIWFQYPFEQSGQNVWNLREIIDQIS